MSHAMVEGYDDPVRLGHDLNRSRQVKKIAAVSALFVALGTLFFASAAMYSADVPAPANPANAVD